MPAPAEAPTILDITKMNRIQKLAALLIMLGPENAAAIMKNLDEHELESVSSEMTKITMIPQDIQRALLMEFTEVAIEAGTAVRGGMDYTQTSLEKAVGLFKASNVIMRVAPSRAPVAAMQQISDLEPRQVFNLIKDEQPQTIALISSFLSPEKGGHLLLMLRPELREQVLERLATLAPTPIEVVEHVVSVITQKLGSKHTRAMNHTGGIKAAANLLNSMEKNASKSLLVALDGRNPELGQAIRQKMFTFEDVASLDPVALQKVLREVDMRDLAIALKTASDHIKTTILGCISKRAAETVAEEMSFMGPLRLREIEAAQLRIIEIVRRLESEGEIDLGETKEQKRDEAMA